MLYFSINELSDSVTAKRLGIDNEPSVAAMESLTDLINHVLDPVREAWGRPVHINSGYRSPALNKAVGGVATSQHLKGEAADITTGTSYDNRRLFDLIIKKKIPFDQLIDEKDYTWIHISFKRDKNRQQVLHLK
jgi:hypothetical protein